MHMFTCALDIDEQHAVARLNGELDMNTVHCVIDRLLPVVTAGRDLVVDLAGINFFEDGDMVSMAAQPPGLRNRLV